MASPRAASKERDNKKRESFRRNGVSSETVTENDIKNFVPKKFTKTSEEKTALKKHLNSVMLFRFLDHAARDKIFDAMEPYKAKKGEAIITQGDEGDFFYLIHHGEVDVHVDKQFTSTLEEGGYFGELALIYNQPRSATCTAKSAEVSLFRLDRTHYRMLLMGSILAKRLKYEKILKEIKFLQELDQWELLTLADALQPCRFKDGEVVFKQGEQGSDFYIILDGEADVYQHKEGGSEEKKMDTLKEGQYFGEIAIILHRPRTATIKSKGFLDCVKVDTETFERILGPCQDIMKRNMANYKTLIDFYEK